MKRAIILLFVIVGLACCVRSARGAIITTAIEGVVDYAYDPYGFLGVDIEVGDLITGTYTYDTDTPDSNPSAQVGDYKHYAYPFGIYLSVGGLAFQTDPASVDFLVEIVNDNAGIDAYLFRSWNNLALASGIPIEALYWSLLDSGQTALSTAGLVALPPILTDWESNRLMIHGPERGASFTIIAHVTSAVPEPGTILLVGLGWTLLRRRK